MSRRLPVLTFGTAVLGLASCLPPAYVQPRVDEPHAILKVRHNVHAHQGPIYRSSVRIGSDVVDGRTRSAILEDAHTFHLRVRPNLATYSVGGVSFHTEMRSVTRQRSVQESYSCSHYQCSGYGASQRCGSVSQTCYRTRYENYTVMESVEVIDDACSRAVRFAPRVGSTYLVQFDYLGENECTLKCLEQVSTDGGEFDLVPCPRAPAAP